MNSMCTGFRVHISFKTKQRILIGCKELEAVATRQSEAGAYLHISQIIRPNAAVLLKHNRSLIPDL